MDPDRGGPDLETGYRSLLEAVGVHVDRRRCVLTVAGDGARRALQGLLTADVDAVTEEQAAYSLVLTAKGRPIADPRVLFVERGFWLDVARDSLPRLMDHFGRYLPPRFARVSGPADLTRVSLIGPLWMRAAAFLKGAAGPGSAGPTTARPLAVRALSIEGTGSVRAVVREPEEGPGLDVYVVGVTSPAIEALAEAAGQAGGALVGPEAFDAWRVERGLAQYGSEITADMLPQETGLVGRTVSFEKGCYTGQEVVARIHYRGHVNRHLRGLRCGLGVHASGGDRLFAASRDVGAVTSAVVSPRLGPIALALVRRKVQVGERLALEPGGPTVCEVRALPFT